MIRRTPDPGAAAASPPWRSAPAASRPTSRAAGGTPEGAGLLDPVGREPGRRWSPLWQPLLDDMSAQIGVKVKPYFATNYTSLVEAMRFKQVQVGWFSASPALEAIRRADGEVLGRVVDAGGDATYKSVHHRPEGQRDHARQGPEVRQDADLRHGRRPVDLGHAGADGLPVHAAAASSPPSASRRCARPATRPTPSRWPTACWTWPPTTPWAWCSSQRQSPALAEKVEVIWTSPPLPESSIVVRKDLDPALKEKIRQFFLTYGTGTDAVGREAARGAEGPGLRRLQAGRQHLPRPGARDGGRPRRWPRAKRSGDAGQDRQGAGRVRQDPAPPPPSPRHRAGRRHDADDRRRPAAAHAARLVQRAPDLLVWGGGDRAAADRLRAGGDAATLPRLFTNSENMRQFGARVPEARLHRLEALRRQDVADGADRHVGHRSWRSSSPMPFGLACARNVSPVWLQQPMRLLMNLLRSVPDLVIGTLFLVAVGLGPFAGVMALAHQHRRACWPSCSPRRWRPSTGGRSRACAPPARRRLHEIVWGVIPQVAPLWTSLCALPLRIELAARPRCWA